MKNLQTFQEFVNESVINEANFAPLEGDQLKFAEQITKLVFDAINKTLPQLAKKYGYKFKKANNQGIYHIIGYYEGKRVSIIDLYMWTADKFKNYSILGSAYPNPAFSNDNLVMPFRNSNSFETKEAAEVIKGWHRLCYINPSYPSIVLTLELVNAYAKFIEDVVDGIELNLKFAKERGVEAKE